MIDLTKKRILVTGGAGFVGQHLIRNLLEKRKVPRSNLFLPTSEQLDLRKWKNCQKAVKNQDIVIHLAAVTGNIVFHQLHPGRIFYDNLIMGIQLIEAAHRAEVEKFVEIGSATEYPEITPIPFKEEDLWSGYPEEIIAPYSLAKKMLLVQGQAYRKEYGFNVIHLLPAAMYGPGMDFKKDYVIPALIKKIDEAKKTGRNLIEVWGTGRATRDFLYVEDAAEGIILAAEKYDKPQPVNLGSGRKISIRELVKTISELMDFGGKIRWDTSKPEGQLQRILDIQKAEKEFDFKAKTSLREGLKKTIEWSKKINLS